jgi:hypothetical protein
MGRPSKLTPQQWTEVERRLLAGETARGIAPDFGISEAGIRKRFGAHQSISAQSAQVRTVAEKLADASLALQALPPAQRSVAVDLAEELRTMSVSVARAANLGAKTGHRLHALANSEVAKVDDAARCPHEAGERFAVEPGPEPAGGQQGDGEGDEHRRPSRRTSPARRCARRSAASSGSRNTGSADVDSPTRRAASRHRGRLVRRAVLRRRALRGQVGLPDRLPGRRGAALRQHYRGIMFRKTYPELEELQARAMEVFPQEGAVYKTQPSAATRSPTAGTGPAARR